MFTLFKLGFRSLPSRFIVSSLSQSQGRDPLVLSPINKNFRQWVQWVSPTGPGLRVLLVRRSRRRGPSYIKPILKPYRPLGRRCFGPQSLLLVGGWGSVKDRIFPLLELKSVLFFLKDIILIINLLNNYKCLRQRKKCNQSLPHQNNLYI